MTLPATLPPRKEMTVSYTPAALIAGLGNTLMSPMLSQLYLVKGVYKPGKGTNYNGVYYDNLKDEQSDTTITLIVSAIQRQQLKDGQLIEANAYLNKRQQAGAARIELVLHVTELVSRQEKIVDEKEQKSLELIQRKAHNGYKDLQAAIKRRLYAQQPVVVTILIGQNAIIDKDIQHQLKDAAIVYHIEFIRINLSNTTEIIQRLKEYDRGEILVLSRGGGENIQLFNNPAIAEAALDLRSVFVTAIGHHDDEPLLQKVADKAFITPTSLGQFLYDTHVQTLEETQHSKVRMIKDITSQVELSFKHTITDLTTKLADNTQLLKETRTTAEHQVTRLMVELDSSRRTGRKRAIVLAVVAAALLLYILVKK